MAPIGVLLRSNSPGLKNPFKKDDAVLTKLKGRQVKATVTRTWKNEVQVKTARGDLLWRTRQPTHPQRRTATNRRAQAETREACCVQKAAAETPLRSHVD